MRIIGISGKIGSGKTFLTNILLEKLGRGEWIRMAFGDILKKEVSETFGFPLDWCYEHKDNTIDTFNSDMYHIRKPPKIHMTIREILQWWGTDVRRAQDENYWCDRMRVWLKDHENGLDGVIVDDVRFPSEVALLIEHKAVLFRLNTYPGWECDPEIAAHESETALDDFTAVWDRAFNPAFGELEVTALEMIYIKKQIFGEVE